MGRDSRRLTGEETRQVREVWQDQLQPIPGDRLDPRLPAATRDFLTAVGLPTVETLGIRFHHDARLSAPLTYAGRDYLVVAESPVPFFLDSESGELYRQGFPQPGPGRFVNSEIAFFVLFLGIYRIRMEVQPLGDELIGDELIGAPSRKVHQRWLTWQEAEAISNELWLKFQKRDPPAVGPINTWWSELLADIDRD